MLYSSLTTIVVLAFSGLFGIISVSSQSFGDGNGFLCSLNCTFLHASAWANVLSLKSLTQSDLLTWASGKNPTTFAPPSTNPDTLDQVCSVHTSYNGCLMKCPDDIFRQGVLNSMSAIQTLCANRQDFPVNDKDCVQKYTPEVQSVCRKENEMLLSTTKQLQEARNASVLSGFAAIFQRLCQSAMDQVVCVAEALHQKCGEGAYDLVLKIFQASLGSVKSLVGDKEGSVPVQCRQMFATIVTQKNGSVSLVVPNEFISTTVPSLMTVTTRAGAGESSGTSETSSNTAERDVSNRNLVNDPTGSAEFYVISRLAILFSVVLFFYVSVEF